MKRDNIEIGLVINRNDFTIRKQTDKLEQIAKIVNSCIDELQEEGMRFEDEEMYKYLLTDERLIAGAALRQYIAEFNRVHNGRFKFTKGVDDKAYSERISAILAKLRHDVPAYRYTRSIEFVDGRAVVSQSAKQKIIDENEIALKTPIQVELYRRATQAAEVLNNLMDYAVKHGINYCPLVSYGGIAAILTIFNSEVIVHPQMIEKALGTYESQNYLSQQEGRI